MSTYAGIDYSLGSSNFDPSTGIRYGVISMHSIDLDRADFESDYGDPHCPTCGKAVYESSAPEVDMDWNDGKDCACIACAECFWSEECFPEEALGWHYDSDGYKLTNCLGNDIFVLGSPYFTYAQFCSPCVPGAGNLDNPVGPDDGGAKCYCLGHDWFDSGKAPYPVYRCADGQEITASDNEAFNDNERTPSA